MTTEQEMANQSSFDFMSEFNQDEANDWSGGDGFTEAESKPEIPAEPEKPAEESKEQESAEVETEEIVEEKPKTLEEELFGEVETKAEKPEVKAEEKKKEAEEETLPKQADSAEIDALKKQIEALTKADTDRKQLEANAQAIAQQKAVEKQAKENKEKGEETPSYMFDIPDQLMGLLNSEDAGERKTGMSNLISGVGQAIHKTVVAEIQQKMETSFNQMPAMMQQMMETRGAQKDIHNDFYGKYPELNNPAIKPLIQQIAEGVLRETKTKEFTPQIRDMIAERTKAILTQMSGSQQASKGQGQIPAQAPAKQLPVQPPAMSTAGRTRTIAPTTEENILREFLGI